MRALLLLLLLLVPMAYAMLSCATEASGVAALRATCNAIVGCRWYYGHYSLADFTDLVVRRLQLVRDEASATLAVQSAFHGDDDARHFFQPESWRAATPAMVGVASGQDGMGSSDCLVVADAAATSQPPLEFVHAALVLIQHAFFMSDDRMCDPETEVAAIDPETKVTYCMVVENRICATSTGIDSGLGTAVMIGVVVILCLMLIIVVTAAVLFWRKRGTLAPAAADEDIPLAEM